MNSLTNCGTSYHGILFCNKNNKVLIHTSWMHLQGIMLNEKSYKFQLQRLYTVIPLIKHFRNDKF